MYNVCTTYIPENLANKSICASHRILYIEVASSSYHVTLCTHCSASRIWFINMVSYATCLMQDDSDGVTWLMIESAGRRKVLAEARDRESVLGLVQQFSAMGRVIDIVLDTRSRLSLHVYRTVYRYL